MWFNGYAKGMDILKEISYKWEGFSKNWGMGSDLPYMLSSEPRWPFEGSWM
jgi:hypothetical protein